jgi:two-component system chemotaxis sensor kinase CheA
MTIDMAQFHQVFFEESFEGLEIMETGLLGLSSGQPDVEEINAIFRAAHSIKGGSGTFGFTAISDFTHVMETLLDEMRDGRREVSSDVVNILLRSVDVLREMLEATQADSPLDEARIADQQSQLNALLEGQTRGSGATETPPSDIPAEPESPSLAGWKISFRPHRGMMQTGNDPYRLIRELADLGELQTEINTDEVPPIEALNAEEAWLSWTFHLGGDVEKAQIEEIFEWVEDDCDIKITQTGQVADEQASEDEAEEPATDIPAEPEIPERRTGSDRRAEDRRTPADRRTSDRRAGGASGGSIRVDIEKIDALINMVGELVITQSMVTVLSQEFSLKNIERLRDGLSQMERHTRELQESVMNIRMLPASFTFNRFPRLVHDLSAQFGKKIELQMSGESTEMDKTVIEKISDPLVHLVRNSLDHGIEKPEERLAMGKPETGIVQLNAAQKGGSIVIEIVDDGKGLDKQVLFEKAVEKGVADPTEVLSDQQIYELIFRPGFSTAAEISDVSGRGVGMDVVRRNITELGGSIEIESELGQGTRFTIRLPLTLAILDGQTVNVGDETYIIPLLSIIESQQVSAGQVKMVAGQGETFRWREEYLPVIRMHDIFEIPSVKHTAIEDGLIVVVEGDNRRCGIFVDDLVGQQQVVIKSLEDNYIKVDGLSGATILGDGSVALILDVAGLIRLFGNQDVNDHVRRSA